VIRSSALILAAGMALLTAVNCGADETFPNVHNEPITVRILGGKNGLPLAHQHLILIAGYDRNDLHDQIFREEAITNAQGQVRLSNQMANLPLLQVWVDKNPLCQANPRAAGFSVEQIRRDGLSTPNRCGTVTVEDAPGVFTVFVKSKEVKVKDPLAKFSLGTATAQTPAPDAAATAPPAAETPVPKPTKANAKSHAALLPAAAVAPAGAKDDTVAATTTTQSVVAKAVTPAGIKSDTAAGTKDVTAAATSAAIVIAKDAAAAGTKAVAKDAVAGVAATPALASQQAEFMASPLAKSVAVTLPAPVPAIIPAIAPAKVAARLAAKRIARRPATHRSRLAAHRTTPAAAACQAPQPAAKAAPAAAKTTSKPAPVPAKAQDKTPAKAPEKSVAAIGKTKPAAGVEQAANAPGKPGAPLKQK
jgi:hypothetical protein